MAVLSFPVNPVDGQMYPSPAIPGLNVYQYDASYNTWRLRGTAGYAPAGVFGDNVTCVEITIDNAGLIRNIFNRPIPDVTNTQKGLLTPGLGLNVSTPGAVDLLPPLLGNIGGVKAGTNISIAPDGTISIPNASLTTRGVVILNNTTSSTDTTQALTAAQGKYLQDQINSLTLGGIALCGTYDASLSQVDFVTSEGTLRGFTIGDNLPVATSALQGSFLIVSVPGTPNPPAPAQPLGAGDWLIADVNPDQWVVVPIGRSILASQVMFTPYDYVTGSNVQTAIEEIVDRTNVFSLSGGVGLTAGPYTLAGGAQIIGLLPPVGGNIGGVKAGNNINIAADGTLSVFGGGAVGTITEVTAGAGLLGGGTSGDVALDIGAGTGITVGPDSISISNTTVTAGAYTYPSITVNAQGQLTAAVSNTPVTELITGVGISASGTTGNVTVNLLAPSGGNIGGVKAGTNITIAADGTISATGGGSGSVTSIATGTGLTGGPITTTGTISLADTAVTPGTYTAANITVDAQGRITAAANGSSGGGGTVTSVNVSGGTTGITFSGGPITTAGTLTASGTLAIVNGGTGATTATDATNALLPAQVGNAGRVLGTDGTNTSWVDSGGVGTVTSVGITPGTGVNVSGSPITSSGNITVGLASTAVTAGSYTLGNFTVNAQGQLTAASSTTPASVAVTTVTAGAGLTGGGGPGAITLDLLAPTGGNIGGVKAGANVNIDVDGTINAIQTPPTTIAVFDDLSAQFDGVTTVFNLTIGGNPLPTLDDITAAVFIDIGGVPQSPVTSYTAVNSQITFTEAPQTGVLFDGRWIYNLTSGSSGMGTVTQVNTGAGLIGGPITTVGTIALDNTSVAPGAYTNANITVDAQGRITAAASGIGGGASFIPIDDIASQFNGVLTTFTLLSGGFPLPAGLTAEQLLISLGGVLQYPEDAYTYTGGNITFTSAPLSSYTFNGRYSEPVSSNVVAVPASSASSGVSGQIAFGAGFFYWHDGAQWLRIAGSTF